MRKKIYWLLFFTAVLFVGIIGCMMKKEDDRERMLSYMKHKYQEEFLYIESYAGQLGKGYTSILVENKKYPERKALVRISVKESRRCFEDNYLAYLLQEELEKEIGQIAEECFGSCEVSYKIPQFVFPEHFHINMTAAEFLSNPYAMPQFAIYPKTTIKEQDIWEKRLDDFREKNAAKAYKIRGTICIVDTELAFSMDKEGKFRYMRWLS